MDLSKIDFRYLKEAFKEPLNFWGMAGFAVAAAFFWDVTPLLLGLGAEGLYLAVVPASPFYRRYVERREKQRQHKLREVETLLEVTARLVVNRASLKLRREPIDALLARLRAVL